MAVTAFTSGVGTNPNAALWSRRDIAPTDTWATTGYAGWLFRIPSTTIAANGDILQFAEFRDRDNDYGCSALYQRRSTNGGETWGTPSVVYRLATYVYAGGLVDGKCLNSFFAAPPLANGTLVGIFTETTIVSSAWTVKQWKTTSTDHGVTWAAPTDISSSVVMYSPKYTGTPTITDDGSGHPRIAATAHGMTTASLFKVKMTSASGVANGTYLVTRIDDNTFDLDGATYLADSANGTWQAVSQWHIPTGNGIKLRSGAQAGRLLFPCDHRFTPDHPEAGETDRIAWSHVLYTDDGVTFGVQGRLDDTAQNATDNANMNECTIAEMEGGNLHMNIRSTAATDPNTRFDSTSADQGANWTDAVANAALPGTSTNASMVALTDGTRYLVWIKETVTRAGLTIAKFNANATTIVNQRTMIFGRSGYSSVIALDQSTLGVAFERTHDINGYSASPYYQEFGWVRFPTAWVNDGDSVGAVTNAVYPTVMDL